MSFVSFHGVEDPQEIESPMRDLVAKYDVHNLGVTPISTNNNLKQVVLNNTNDYARVSFQDNMCSYGRGDVLDEIRLLDKSDATLHLVIGSVVVPKPLEFVGGVAKLDPPIFLSFLHFQIVRLEDNRQATWVTGVFKHRPVFNEGTYFYETYRTSQGVSSYAFQFGGLFALTSHKETSNKHLEDNYEDTLASTTSMMSSL